MRCGAKKRNGEPCPSWAVKGRTRCRMHGGKTLVGSASGTYRHGRYTKYLPARLASQYRDASQDPELLSLRQDIAMVDARIADLLIRVDTGESGALWKALQHEWEQFHLVRDLGDIPKMHAALARLDALMARAVQDALAWADVTAQIELRRKLCESENKRLVAMQQLLSVEQALMIAAQLVDIVTRHVSDKQALSQIVTDMQSIMDRGGLVTDPPI